MENQRNEFVARGTRTAVAVERGFVRGVSNNRIITVVGRECVRYRGDKQHAHARTSANLYSVRPSRNIVYLASGTRSRSPPTWFSRKKERKRSKVDDAISHRSPCRVSVSPACFSDMYRSASICGPQTKLKFYIFGSS